MLWYDIAGSIIGAVISGIIAVIASYLIIRGERRNSYQERLQDRKSQHLKAHYNELYSDAKNLVTYNILKIQDPAMTIRGEPKFPHTSLVQFRSEFVSPKIPPRYVNIFHEELLNLYNNLISHLNSGYGTRINIDDLFDDAKKYAPNAENVLNQLLQDLYGLLTSEMGLTMSMGTGGTLKINEFDSLKIIGDYVKYRSDSINIQEIKNQNLFEYRFSNTLNSGTKMPSIALLPFMILDAQKNTRSLLNLLKQNDDLDSLIREHSAVRSNEDNLSEFLSNVLIPDYDAGMAIMGTCNVCRRINGAMRVEELRPP